MQRIGKVKSQVTSTKETSRERENVSPRYVPVSKLKITPTKVTIPIEQVETPSPDGDELVSPKYIPVRNRTPTKNVKSGLVSDDYENDEKLTLLSPKAYTDNGPRKVDGEA